MRRRSYVDKTVLVTGAARGLGKALCRSFGCRGARIGGLDVRPDELESTCRELSAEGIEMVVAEADLVDEKATRRAVARVRDELGPIEVLINNAGVTHIELFDATGAPAVRRLLEVNTLGAVHATAAAYDDLIAGHGQIIVISSVAGYAPLVARAGYSASKHALHGFFETLRAELTPHGVDVLMVCPSSIATGIREREQDPRARPVGAEDRPEEVAARILDAAARRKRLLNTGRTGRAAYWIHRLAPRLYEALMRRQVG